MERVQRVLAGVVDAPRPSSVRRLQEGRGQPDGVAPAPDGSLPEPNSQVEALTHGFGQDRHGEARTQWGSQQAGTVQHAGATAMMGGRRPGLE